MADEQHTPRAALRSLFLDIFAPDELRRFVGDRWPELEYDLPGDHATPMQLADDVAQGLARRGLVDAALRSLTAARPGRIAEISACATRWPADGESSRPPGTGVQHRLRTAFAAGHATTRLIGFPHRGPKPAVRLQDACVPLRMSRGESVVPWTVPRLVGHLLAAREPAARVVVLGDPGSGKSTLCQYLTVLLAGGVHVPGVQNPELVPLSLLLRDVVRRGGSLLQCVRERADELGVEVGPEQLTRICDEGRAVLILDGLDEVGDPVARAHERDRLLAFLSLHPRLPVLVSSREVGYGEVPLPDRGEGAFLHLHMAPLSDEEIGEFARRWYAVCEEEPAARTEGGADLAASILAAPAVRALAGNRLLMTLIALIHRQDARLPGERVALFERCMQLFLDTWPALRGRRFTEISPARQRRLLQTLAASLVHREHQRRGNDMSMTRASLVAALESYWRADQAGAGDLEPTISAWVDHLHEESGVFSEVGPGVHQFIHRSLQEYLAACWYMHTSPDPAGVIVARHRSTTDREVWRMLAGMYATAAEHAEGLFQRMTAGVDDHTETWSFLLDCLGEEVNFSPSAVATILKHVLGVAARGSHASATEQAIARLCRFSTRHRHIVRRWLEHGLRGGPREELAALVWAAAAALPIVDVIAAIDARPDRLQAAATLVPDLWPLGELSAPDRPELDAIGRWAWSALDLEAALAVFADRRVPPAELRPAAMMLLAAGLAGPVTGALTLQLAIDASALAAATAASPAWHGVHAIAVEPGRLHLPVAIVAPVSGLAVVWSWSERSGRRRLYRHGRFTPALRDDGAVDPDMISDRFEGIRLFDYLLGPDDPTPDDFWVDAGVPYGLDCFEEPDEFGDYESMMPGNDYPLKEFERDEVGDLSPDFSVTDVPGDCVVVSPPDVIQGSRTYDVRARMIDLRAGSEPAPVDSSYSAPDLVEVSRTLHALHAGHATIAARSFAGDGPLAALASETRQQSAWVLQNWRAVEQALSDESSPTLLALVLTLGWTQCLTTARWPDSPRWRALLRGPPPGHWWPRLHWHLCWSMARPNDDEHRAASLSALADGSRDPAFGELAQRWSRLFGKRHDPRPPAATEH